MKWLPMKRLAALAVALLAVLSVPGRGQAAEELRVLTSYPQEMMDRYQHAFESANPDVHLVFSWGHTPDAMATLRQPQNGGIDVFWSPAMKAFPLLAAEGVFQPLGDDMLEGLPRRLGKQWISDPQGRYAAFEIASFGFALRRSGLAEHKLPEPHEWKDLGKQIYAGRVVMPVPSVIGFAPPMIDAILQRYGWTEGWKILGKIGANAGLLDGGGGVAMMNSLTEGGRDIAMTIDFFARAARADGKDIDFVTPAATAWVPAQVGLTSGSQHGAAARRFIRFLLSEEGQALLLSPELTRLPARPSLYQRADLAPVLKTMPNPFAAVDSFAFDPDKATQREKVVAALFDEMIVRRHEELQALWPAVRQQSGATLEGQKARSQAAFVPVSEAEASSPEMLALFASPSSAAAMAEREKWRKALDESWAAARKGGQ